MEGILRDGFIRPATAFVPKGERRIVCFSSNQDYEHTATATLNAGEVVGGLYRIGFLPALDIF